MGNTSVGNLAAKVMKQLEDYAKVTTEGMKKAVNNAGKTVRKEIQAGAPARTGAYKKSWKVKKTDESSNKLEVTVHSSKPGLPHLLEHGHAKRGGGRVPGKPHIAPAEQKGIKKLETEIERALK